MKVKDIITRVALLYHDEDFARVSRTQYLQFLDDALMQLVLTRPDSHTVRRVVKLEEGTKQDLPADGYSLIDIYANMIRIGSSDEYGIGKPVFQVDRKDLDYFNSWHASDPTMLEIDEFAYDNRSPKKYWVNPPIDHKANVHVEMEYSYGFEQYADMAGTFEEALLKEIPVDDLFRMPVCNYMLYLLYSTDSTSQFDTQLAAKYEKSFYQSLGVEYSAAVDVLPRIIAKTLAGVGVPLNAVQPTQAG